MELKSPLFALPALLVSLLLILGGILISNQRRRESRRSQNLPPGPWKLPLIGNFHQVIAGGSLPWRTFRDLATKHGPIMHLQVGQVSTVVVSSPPLAKQILHTHDLSFLDRPQLFGSDVLFHNRSDLIFSPYGDFWRQMRKLCALELLSNTKVSSYRNIREGEVSDLVSSLLPYSPSSPINLTEKIFELSSAVTCRTAFGSNFKGRDELLPLVDNVSEFFGGLNVADVFPSLQFLNVVTGINGMLQNTHRKFDSVLDDMIKDYRSAWLGGERNCCKTTAPVEEDENLLDALIRLQQA